jgi:hypothetical protein
MPHAMPSTWFRKWWRRFVIAPIGIRACHHICTTCFDCACLPFCPSSCHTLPAGTHSSSTTFLRLPWGCSCVPYIPDTVAGTMPQLATRANSVAMQLETQILPRLLKKVCPPVLFLLATHACNTGLQLAHDPCHLHSYTYLVVHAPCGDVVHNATHPPRLAM